MTTTFPAKAVIRKPRRAAALKILVVSDGKTMTVTRRVVRAGGWMVARRLIKPVPVIGAVFAIGLAGYEIRKKGLWPGVCHVGLDVTPVIGTCKNVIEIFTGDLIPDKEDRKKKNGPINVS